MRFHRPAGSNGTSAASANDLLGPAVAVAALILALLLPSLFAAESQAYPSIATQAKQACAKKKGKAKKTCIRNKTKQLNRDKGVVGVMTRNLYLGADLGPAIRSSSLTNFFRANGQILRDVDANNFPVRARGLAAEINAKAPDLVGLQEVALWRTGEAGVIRIKPGSSPESFTTNTVKYDFLKLLLDQLNKGKKRYEVVKTTIEFDFQGPAFYDDDPGLVAPDVNGRLTMRDVILARVGAGVSWSNAQGDNYDTIYAPRISGVPVTVDRGWNSVEVQVRNSPKFKFVNTHLEAFGDDKNQVVDCMTDPAPEYVSNTVSVRCSQAKELYEKQIGPSRIPVVAVGDFNSDDDTVIDANCPSAANTGGALGTNGGVCGDTFAFNALKTLGMRDLNPGNPMSCCLKSDFLSVDSGGSNADFDHYIDHVLTREQDPVSYISSAITGLEPANGFWNSDHAGGYTRLRISP